MHGLIRFINPDRGQAPAALAGRLLAFRQGSGTGWEIVALEGGCQYQPGRSFSGRELLGWLEDGASGPEPEHWEWRVFGPWGVDRLKNPPSIEELRAVSREALALGESVDLPILDRFEVWASDKASGRPLALLATSIDYVQAESIGFWPAPTGRIANRYDHTGDLWKLLDSRRLSSEAEEFQRRVNARIASDSQTGLYPFLRRIFERLPDGSALEHDRGTTRPVPNGYLPLGHLAEPLESERVALLRSLVDGKANWG